MADKLPGHHLVSIEFEELELGETNYHFWYDLRGSKVAKRHMLNLLKKSIEKMEVLASDD